MLAEQILAVVVPVRRADDGVDVIARRLVVVKHHAREVVELDENDRTVDTGVLVESLSAKYPQT